MGFAFDPSSALRTAVLVLVIMVWGVAVLVVGLKGGHVDRPNRVPLLYGYTVCLVALITMLLTVPTLVDNLFTLANPAHGDTRFGFGASLGSFEAYKATQRQRPTLAEAVAGREAPPEGPVTDEELRKQYEALRADQIASNLFDARRSLVRNGLLLVLALGLFVGHWRWLRRQTPVESPRAAA
jgi:hypothetical protein